MTIKMITDDMGNGGRQLSNLKDSLEKINVDLGELQKTDKVTNLYDSNALGIIIYETEYKKTWEISEGSYEKLMNNAETALSEYLNPVKKAFVLNYIQTTGNVNDVVWREINENTNSGNVPGKLLKEGKAVNEKFIKAVNDYYDAYTEYESRKGSLVGIYKNNGEVNKSGSPENLIELAYISDLNLIEPDVLSNTIADLILNNTGGKVISSLLSKLTGTGKSLLTDAVTSLIKIDKIAESSNEDLDEILIREKNIIIDNIGELYGSHNLSGVSDDEFIVLNTLRSVGKHLDLVVNFPSEWILQGVNHMIDALHGFATKEQSYENGYAEYDRYDERENLQTIFSGDNGEKVIWVKDNNNFPDVVGDSLEKNIINGDGKSNMLQALAGDENIIRGNAGNDILIGAKQSDTLIGGLGNDTYIYKLGFGHDLIIEGEADAGGSPNGEDRYGNDSINFENINFEDVNVYRKNNDLVFEVNVTNKEGSVTVKNYFKDNGIKERSTIDYVKFSNRELMSVSNFLKMGNDQENTLTANSNHDTYMYGNDGIDYLHGKSGDDTIYGDDYQNISRNTDYLYGNDGNDTLYGGKGNDMLFGGDHNDTLYGGDDNDRLYGGAGEDKLYGQKGNDTYVVRAGDGLTTIIDEFGNDTLDLSDFEFEDVKIYRDMLKPSRLRIKSNDMSNGNAVDITIKNYFDSEGNFGGRSVDLVKFKNQEPSNLFTNYKLKASENEIVDFTTIGEKDLEVSNGISDVGSNKSNNNENTITVDAIQEYMTYSRKDNQLIIKAHDSNWNLIDTKKVENFFSETNDVYRPNNDNKHFISFSNKKNVDLSDIWRTGIEEHWIVDEKSWLKKDTGHDPVITDNPNDNEMSVGGAVQMGLISERENNAGRVSGHVINDKALYKFTDVGELILGEHTSNKPKWKWITGTETDKSDSRIEFSYGGHSFKLYVNTGRLVKNGQSIQESASDSAIYNGKTMISQEYINIIFGLKAKEENSNVYSIDSDKNADRYSDLYDLSLTELDKENLEEILNNLTHSSQPTNSQVIGIGNTVVVSKGHNNLAFELTKRSYMYKSNDGSSHGTNGYELDHVLDGFKDYVVLKEKSNNYYEFKFDDDYIIIDHRGSKPLISIDGSSINLTVLPGMKNNKLIISPEVLEKVFNLKNDRRVVSNKKGTTYFIDEGTTVGGFANILGNEFYYDAKLGKFIVTNKYSSTTSINSAVDNVVDRYHDIRGNAGGDSETVRGGRTYKGTDESESLYGDDGRNKIRGEGGNDEIEGGDGRDDLRGGDGNDLLYGDDGRDSLFGEDGDDVFESSEGNDKYKGGRGSDIYSIDDESVRIDDIEYTGADGKPDTGIDTVLFHETNWNDVRLVKNDNALHILIDPNDDTKIVDIYYYFSDESRRPEQYAFVENDLIVTNRDLMEKFVKQNGNLITSGTSYAKYDKGQGKKEIETFDTAYDLTIHKSTTIDMGVVKSTDVEIMVNKNKVDLIISVKDTDDYMVVKDYFMSEGAYVDSLKFADGVIWSNTSLLDKIDKNKIHLSDNDYKFQASRNNIEDYIKGSQSDNKIWTYEGADKLEGCAGNDQLFAGEGDDTLYGGKGNDILIGAEGSDILYGDEDNDMLNGGSGSDYLYGGDGNDTLIGGIGNDYLYGHSGNNVYKFSKGFGRDVIYINNINSKDIISFEDINSNEVMLERVDKDLLIKIIDTQDKVRVSNCYDGYSSKLKGISFANHITISEEQILKTPQKIIGTDYSENIVGTANYDAIFGNAGDDKLSGGMNNDELYGGLGSDILYGEDGDDYLSGGLDNDKLSGGTGNDTLSGGAHNDYLIGNTGDDKLLGGSGNDVMEGNDGDDILIGNTGIDSLFGGDGDDTLIGGEHNDYLEGGKGNDTYIFKRGFGQDEIIINNYNTDHKSDIIQFEDISSKEIEIFREDLSNDLIIKIKGSDDQIKIKKFYESKVAMISHIMFSDNVEWQGLDIVNYTKKLTFDVAKGIVEKSNLKESGDRKRESGYISSIFENVDYRFLWKTIIEGDNQNDYLIGDNSSDVIIGGDGNDILNGKKGYDVYTGGKGSDVYIVESGSKIINDNDYDMKDTDVVYFKNSNSNNINIERQGYNLKITYNPNEHVYINGFFANKKYRPEFYVFENDEAVLTEKDIIEKYTNIHGVDIDKENNEEIIKLDRGFGFRELVAIPKDENFNVQTSVKIDMEINSSECRLMRSSDSEYLMLQTKMSDDLLLIKDYFNENDNYNYIHSIRFSDGVVWDSNYLINNTTDIAYILTSGRDVIDGKDLADKKIIYSQDGRDELFMKYGKHIIYGGRGDDRISTGVEDDEIYGGSGWDRIWADDGNDKIFGGSGEDRLNGLDGDDYIDGGADDDEIDGGEGHDTLYGGSGNDRIWGQKGDDIIYGDEGNDFLHGSFGDDKIFGGAGDDIISGNSGKDVFEGGLGKDTYYVIKEEDVTVINFNEVVNDKIIFDEIDSTEVKVIGLDENKFILGSESGDFGGVYIDYINFAQDDQLSIEFDDDVVWNNDDILNAINQYIKENPNVKNKLNADIRIKDDAIVGLPVNNDILHGTDKNDMIYGFSGDDILYSSQGADQFFGGTGRNKYLIEGDFKTETINFDVHGEHNIILKDLKKEDVEFAVGRDQFIIHTPDVEKVLFIDRRSYSENNKVSLEFADGTKWEDDFIRELIEKSLVSNIENSDGKYTGTNNDEIIIGYSSDDNIHGADGDDILYGSLGDDELYGDVGNDILYTGKGDDESYGGIGNDLIYGNLGDDKLYGDQGNDKLYGGIDNDELYGGTGNDILYGGLGNDELYGGTGNDILYAGLGNDELYGGLGENIYILEGDFNQDNIIIERHSINNIHFKDILSEDLGIIITDDQIVFHTEKFNQVASIDLKDYSADTAININFSNGELWDDSKIKKILNDSVKRKGTDENNNTFGTNSDDFIVGTKGDDKIYGNLGDDVLRGEAGKDYLYGGEGNDILYGGIGRNTLDGGKGQNTYFISKNSINHIELSERVDDKIVFKGIDSKDVHVVDMDERYFVLASKDSQTAVRMRYIDLRGDETLSIEFADGVIWDDIKLESLIKEHYSDNLSLARYLVESKYYSEDGIFGLPANSDIINGTDGDDKIYGLTGNDTIYTGKGEDVIFGGEGDDIIHLSSGCKDVLADVGNNKIYFHEIDDLNRINYSVKNSNHEVNLKESNTIIFENLSLDDVEWGMDDSYIVFSKEHGEKSVGIRLDEFDSSDELIIEFADGIKLTSSEMLEIIERYRNDRMLMGSRNDDRLRGDNSNDNIHGRDGNDTIIGYAGDDELFGDGGHDVLIGGEGDDKLHGGFGVNTLAGGKGQDTYYISRNSNNIIDFDEQVDDKIIFEDINSDDIRIIEMNEERFILSSIDKKTKVGINYIDFTDQDQLSIKFNDDVVWNNDDILSAINQYIKENPNTKNKLNADVRIKDDAIVGLPVNSDILLGTDKNDKIYGFSGDDILYSSQGDDLLFGGTGRNQYVIEGDFNSETITFDAYGEHNIIFKDLKKEDVEFAVGRDRFIIHTPDVEKVLFIERESYSENNKISFEFANGEKWEDDYIRELIEKSVVSNIKNSDVKYIGTDNDETIIGYSSDDNIHGADGNDIIYGSLGDDKLYGNDGDDILYAGKGDDTLYGGHGDDLFYSGLGENRFFGGAGNNSYHFSKENGETELLVGIDSQGNLIKSKTNETIILNNSLAEDVYFVNEGGHLVIVIDKPMNQLIGINLEGYSQDNKISIQFKNGEIWRDHLFRSILNSGLGNYERNENGLFCGSQDNDFITGSNYDNSINGMSGNDVIYGISGENIIYGGDGNDVIYGGIEDDILYGNEGNDRLYGNKGDDVIYGGSDQSHIFISNDNGIDIFHLDPDAENNIYLTDYQKDEITALRQDNDLHIIKDNENKIIVSNYYTNETPLIDKLYFSDETPISRTDIDNLVMNDKRSGKDIYTFDANKPWQFNKLYTDNEDSLNLNYADNSEASTKNNLLYDFKVTKESDDLNISYDNNHSFTVDDFFIDNSKQFDNLVVNDTFEISSNGIELLIQSMSEYCSENGVDWTDQNVRENEDMQQMILSSFNSIA